MISFESDYIKGAHELILKRLLETNNEALSGYGEDKYCISAKEKIKKAVGREDAEVFLLTGGTQTNQIFIVLDNDKMNELSSNVLFSFWEKADSGHTVVRFASSWATTEEDVTKLAEYL